MDSAGDGLLYSRLVCWLLSSLYRDLVRNDKCDVEEATMFYDGIGCA